MNEGDFSKSFENMKEIVRLADERAQKSEMLKAFILASNENITQDEINGAYQIYIIGYLDALMDGKIKDERN
jgi:hypothetical protein